MTDTQDTLIGNDQAAASDTLELWRRAAAAMRNDRDSAWHAVADWLDLEAATQGTFEPLIDLLNVAIETETGTAGYLKLGRTEAGEIATHSDTNEGATAVARAYLQEEE